jgi:hypothetical protein
MSMKPPVPFHELDNDYGGQPVPNGASGVEQKMLSEALDNDRKVRVRTRQNRFRPGTIAPDVRPHDYWEKVYLVSGKLVNGCDAHRAGGTEYAAASYACGLPGTRHGPLTSDGGCVFFEIKYNIGATDGS